jgi:hypothetical protein
MSNFITAIDEHLHTEKPEPFAIMERIINEKMAGKFGFFECYFSNNICHSLYIQFTIEPRTNWSGGYIMNAHRFMAHIFCGGQWYREGMGFSFEPSIQPRKSYELRNEAPKARAKRERNPEKLALYVCSQLEKFLKYDFNTLQTS